MNAEPALGVLASDTEPLDELPAGSEIAVTAEGISAVCIEGVNRYQTAANVARYGVDEAGMSWDGVGTVSIVRFFGGLDAIGQSVRDTVLAALNLP